MSPRSIAVLRAIERDTRRLAASTREFDRRAGIIDRARYPRDYHRPLGLLRMWGGPGRFFWVGERVRF